MASSALGSEVPSFSFPLISLTDTAAAATATATATEDVTATSAEDAAECEVEGVAEGGREGGSRSEGECEDAVVSVPEDEDAAEGEGCVPAVLEG